MSEAVASQGAVTSKQGEAIEGANKPNPSPATPAAKDTTPGAVKQTSETPAITPEQYHRVETDAKTYKGRYTTQLEENKRLKDELTKRDHEREDAELDTAVNELPEKDREAKKANLKTVTDRIRAERQQLSDLLSKHSPVLAVLEELGITDAQSLKDTITKARTTQFDMTIATIAEKANVSADVLKDKAGKLKVTDEAGIEELASFMPKKIAPGTPDTGKNVGGGNNFNDMSPAEKIRYGMEHPEQKMT